MIDPINEVLTELVLAETSEPRDGEEPTKAAKLYRKAFNTLQTAKGFNIDLVDTNTRYLMRARTSEAYLQRLLTETVIDADLLEEILAYLTAGPWNLSVAGENKS